MYELDKINQPTTAVACYEAFLRDVKTSPKER